MRKFKLITLLGIRPDIIRLHKLISLLDEGQKNGNYEHILGHTGQHFDYELDGVFYKELGVRLPDFNLGVGKTLKERGGPTGYVHQIGLLFEKVQALVKKEKPDAVLYLGDTNSVFSSFIVAREGVPVIHIEGGGRSYDWRLPEEKVRMTTDHLSDLIFCYLPRYKKILLREGVPDFRVVVVGNIIDDAVKAFLPKAIKRNVLKRLGLKEKAFVLVTIHREENTEYKENLTPRINDLIRLSKEIPVVFPIMPRVRQALERFGLDKKLFASSVMTSPPIGFLDFLALENYAKAIVTDSGTVQEEALILGTPCFVTRKSTERPETLKAGATLMSDANLYENTKKTLKMKIGWDRNVLNPFGTSPSEVIFKDLIKKISDGYFSKSRSFDFNKSDPFIREVYGKFSR